MSWQSKHPERPIPRLLPADRRHGVAEDNRVRFLFLAGQRLPRSTFAVSLKGCGAEQCPPHLMLVLLSYGSAHGLFGLRARRAGQLW